LLVLARCELGRSCGGRLRTVVMLLHSCAADARSARVNALSASAVESTAA